MNKHTPNSLLVNMVLSAGLLLYACQKDSPQTVPEDIHATYMIAEDSKILNPVRTTGKLSSKTEYKLSFKTGGIIAEISAAEGEEVKKGQMLASLDLSEIRAQVDQAQLAVDKARRDFQRTKNLYEDSVVTLEQFQNATTALELSLASLKIAEFNLAFSRINAPANGIILKKFAEENEIISPGYPVMQFASTQSEWVMDVNITDKDRVDIGPGDSARVRFDAFGEKDYPAEVSEIGSLADPYTGTYEVELNITRPLPQPVNGLIGTAFIFPSELIEWPTIPAEALIEGEGMQGIVYKWEKGEAIKTNVRIHEILDNGLVIENGVNPGDTIIVEGATYLRPGSQVVLEKHRVK